MVKGIIGRKVGITGIYSQKGEYIPVTVIEAGPCKVTQVKNLEKDKYEAVQLGFGLKKEKRTTKPLQGHFKKTNSPNFRILCEFEAENIKEINAGQNILVDIFKEGDNVMVSGTSKGRGFSGVVRRHGFSGGPATHGSHCVRIPGSIGASSWPSRVFKGKKLPGHYGNKKATVLNLKIVKVEANENLLFIKGSVPGPNNGIITIIKR